MAIGIGIPEALTLTGICTVMLPMLTAWIVGGE
ncbi:Uncharacterised protein [Pseudomonas luteola]|uniref:Uncharacterized protein n=1 Tax=Pseudomonas luteola TaxID=47886 RepID=A0A2X2C3N6_PSELU|nr:hypothetical protein SAMN05216295_11362 [Pseudomonas zeshuii]SPZ00126.1 Uncharacterised protein [Pseudomonas luteola]SPZ00333.1 Uncharacterised protein [Pseudomonas luteola]